MGYKNSFFEQNGDEIFGVKNAESMRVLDEFLSLKVELKKQHLERIEEILFAHALDKNLFSDAKKFGVAYFVNDSLVDKNLSDVWAFFYEKKLLNVRGLKVGILDVLAPLSDEHFNDKIIVLDGKIILILDGKIAHFSSDFIELENEILQTKSIFGYGLEVVELSKKEVANLALLYAKNLLNGNAKSLPNLIKKDYELPSFSLRFALYFLLFILFSPALFFVIYNYILEHEIKHLDVEKISYNAEIEGFYTRLNEIKNKKFQSKLKILESIFERAQKYNLELEKIELKELKNSLKIELNINAKNKNDIERFCGKDCVISNLDSAFLPIKSTLKVELKNDKK